MRLVTVYLTRHDIEHGIAGDCESCPIALAVSRAAGEPWMVGGDTITRRSDPEGAGIDLPKEAAQFVLMFDKFKQHYAEVAEPFKFVVEIPEIGEPISMKGQP